MKSKRPEIKFSRTEMEVMPQAQLIDLKRSGTEYERMHANAILDDRSNGNTSNHGYPAIPELMASAKGQRSVTGIKDTTRTGRLNMLTRSLRLKRRRIDGLS